MYSTCTWTCIVEKYSATIADRVVPLEATRAATITRASILLGGKVKDETKAAARIERVTAEPNSKRYGATVKIAKTNQYACNVIFSYLMSAQLQEQ